MKIFHLTLLLFLFSSCSEQKDESSTKNKTEENADEESTTTVKVEEENTDLAITMKDYLGEYVCCPNEKGRDLIAIKCDNTKPSSYKLTFENNQLVLTALFWQDAISNSIADFSFKGDTLILKFTYNNQPAIFKISSSNSFIYDNRYNIESNGWIRNPAENGWSVEGCDAVEDL